MKVTILPTEHAVARRVAGRLCAAVRERPDVVLGLPTGHTPIPIYRRLAAMRARELTEFGRVSTFNLDEFVGLGAADPGSYRAFMQRHFVVPMGIEPSRVHVLNGLAENLEAECVRYERAIAAAGGIDIQMLGIGANGHIGFNEPARELQPRTHVAQLRLQTRRANAALFDRDVSRVPVRALSMGIATILDARAIVLVATGRNKRRAVAAMIEGGITTRLPASVLQLHRQAEVFLDEAAASELKPDTRLHVLDAERAGG